MEYLIQKTIDKLKSYIIEEIPEVDPKSIDDEIIFILELKDEKYYTIIQNLKAEKNKGINEEERNILTAIDDAYVSAYRLIGGSDNEIKLYDELTKEIYRLENRQVDSMKKGSYYLAKIARYKGYSFMLGRPIEIAEEEFIDLHNIVIGEYQEMLALEGKLSFKSFLKANSLETLLILERGQEGNPFFDHAIEDLFEDLDEYNIYMENKLDQRVLDAYNFALVEIYDLVLKPVDLNLKDIDKIDVLTFFMEIIEEEIIITQEELNTFINALKSYVNFLAKIDRGYAKKKTEMREISKNRFKLMKKLRPYSQHLDQDPRLIDILTRYEEEEIGPIVKDVDTYLLYMTRNSIKLTARGNLKRVDLELLSEEIRSSMEKKRPNKNQSHYKLIDFIFSFTKEIGIIVEEDLSLRPTSLAINYMRKPLEKKYALLLSYLMEYREGLAQDMERLKEDNNINDFLDQVGERNFRLLLAFNLLEVNILTDTIKLTQLGREVEKYYKNSRANMGNVIQLRR